MSHYDMSVFCISARFVTRCSWGCLKETAKYIFLSNFKERTIQISTKTYFFFYLFIWEVAKQISSIEKKTMIYLYVHVLDILVTYCHISKLFLKEKKNRYIMIKYGTMSVIAAWWLLNQHSHVLISKCPLRGARRGNSVVWPVTHLIRGIYISIIFYDE